ncbi:hypothetical protein AAVH_43088 [Aphelenchoides avenae]|nr:hypothetical protein AAVH_43088 [Aphelenchus avenae]
MSGSGSRRTKKASKSQRAAEKAAARWNKPPPLQPVFAAGDEFMETEETLSPADRLIEGRQRRKRRFEELAKEAAEAKKMPMLEQILENDAVRDGDVQILHNLLDELATVESDEAGFDGELRMSLSDVGESDEPQSSATGRQMDEYLAIRTENAEYRRKLVDLANAYAASNDKLKDVRGKLYDRTRALKRVQGKEVIPQALKPYSSMTEMGRVTAQRRLQSLVSKAFPHNTDDDNKNMLQAAYPDAYLEIHPLRCKRYNSMRWNSG